MACIQTQSFIRLATALAPMAGIETEDDHPQQKAQNESRREREFYRYFEPIQAWTANGPKLCDLNSEASVAAHAPVSSPDPALTAFCQLGALRCGTRRAMLFFFDKQYAYILAEATQSLSLLDDSIQDSQDSIWLGHAKIPRGHSVCEHTALHLQPPEDESDEKAKDRSLVHVINNLTEDTNFCDRPFVTTGVKARFYAGVPIRTPRGINIGAYCLLDDKPRDGLKDTELTFLRHMASTVMNHLEMVRAKSQHERATRMVAGIGSFVDGATDLGRGANEESSNMLQSELRSTHPRHFSKRKQDQTTTGSYTTSDSRKHSDLSWQEQEENRSSQPSSEGSAGHSPAERSTSAHTPLSVGEGSSAAASSRSKRTNDLSSELISSNVRKTFERATHVLRDAVELDGVIFLDASTSSYGGLVAADQSTQSEANSETAHSSTDEGKADEERHHAHGRADEGKLSQRCNVLASSYCHNGKSTEQAPAGTQISEKFLKKLLRRYPKGKIWNFSQEGISSSDDDSKSDSSSASANPAQDILGRKKARQHSRLEDGRRLAQHFPQGVRSLAIMGMWNQISGRWHAASIVWTYNDLRSLTDDLDVPFFQAFSDVLMAEVHRLEAQKSDKAKVDFISSISHELRSPLHGILGSVECVQEQGTDDFTAELVSQIEACGRTLLDIVNSLLDFSKINYYGRKIPEGDCAHRQNQLSAFTRTSGLGNMMSLDTVVSLDDITEEVVDTSFYSFCSSKEKGVILDRKVAMILDIERGSDVDWRCRIAPGGWKRIIMNLVLNALKYTSEGYVHVSLRKKSGEKKRKRNALLTIKDSGHGMSKAFLQDRLFTAFAQENSFTDGTGLGMNLVATIVRAIGGKIEVQSEQNVGTSVCVQIPLEEPTRDERTDAEDESVIEPDLPEGITIAMPSAAGHSKYRASDLSAIQTTSQGLVTGSVVKTCAELGVRTVSLDHSDAQHADVVLVTDDQISRSSLQPFREFNHEGSAEDRPSEHNIAAKPLIVLCGDEIRLREFRAAHPELVTRPTVSLIRQPAGPNRISKAIRACLSAKIDRDATSLPDGVYGINMNPQARSLGNTMQTSLPLPHRPGSGRASDLIDGETPNVEGGARASTGIERGPKQSRPADLWNDRRTRNERSEGALRASHPLTQQMSTEEDANSVQDRTKLSKVGRPGLKRAESGLTLMLVDDNAINLQLLTTYANKHGHLNIRAHNGQHALDAYKAACTGQALPPHLLAIQTSKDDLMQKAPRKPQVILMDINMPVLNGFEATQRIREFERSRGFAPAIIVALTGLGSASARQEAHSSGVDLFLTKPVKLKELGKILEGVPREQHA